jgi:hypothetical protein
VVSPFTNVEQPTLLKFSPGVKYLVESCRFLQHQRSDYSLGYWSDDGRVVVQLDAEVREFLLSEISGPGLGLPILQFNGYPGSVHSTGHRVELTIYPNLGRRLKMRAAILPLPHMQLWGGD